MDESIELSALIAEVAADLVYEDAYARLEAIVTALEDGEYPLETTVTLYQRGQQLARHCAVLLDKAELRVRQIAGEGLVDFSLENE